MPLILLSFPFAVIGISMLGFACGIPLTRAHFVLAIGAVALGNWFVLKKENRLGVLMWWLLLLFSSILLAALPVMYSVSDAAVCHRPGAFLLANGWNPIYQTEYADLHRIANSFFDSSKFMYHPQHVGFVPRAAWIYAAVLYKVFGFVEIGDSFNLYSAITLLVVSITWMKRFTRFPRYVTLGLSLILVACPYSIAGIFGGCVDSAMYSLLIAAFLCTDAFFRDWKWRDIVAAGMAYAVAGGIKFGALPYVFLVPMAYVVFACIRDGWGKRVSLAVLPVGILVLVFLLNASPYLTSTYHHASPFYPAHSFDKNEKIADNMTFDFDVMNEDAAAMGYWGRFAYAYLTKTGTKLYYRHKLRQEKFDPQLRLFCDVDGLGAGFRVFLICALGGLFFMKDWRLRILAGVLVASIFLLPGKYMGYGRYVAPVYVVPILVSIGVVMRYRHKWTAACVLVAMSVYSVSLLIGRSSLLGYPYMWLMSIQNLQMVQAVEKDLSPLISTRFYYCAHAIKYDTNCNAVFLEPAQAKACAHLNAYGPCSGKCQYLTKNVIPDFRDFACHATTSKSIMDKSFSDERRKGVEKYFFREFLPKEALLLPKRFAQVLAYRGRQFRRVWR